MAKIERRPGTTTEGKGLGHSWADDNVERGDPDVVFEKRRPTYPIGDDPHGREIDFEDQRAPGNTKVLRQYRDLVPIEGQDPFAPKRFLKVGNTKDLRPEKPKSSVDFTALAAAQEVERALLLATDFGAIFPTVSLTTPGAGSSYTPGSTVEIRAEAADIRAIYSATLSIDGRPVERRVLDRRDQDSTRNHTFVFLYSIPANRPLGPMEITVRVFDIETSNQGFIADDALFNTPEIDKAVGTLDGRIGTFGGTEKTAPKLEASGFLRTPEAAASITVNIV